MSQCDALRNGMMPGSSLCTSAPSDRKSNAPFFLMFKPVLTTTLLVPAPSRSRLCFHFVVAQNLLPESLRLQNDFDRFPHRAAAADSLRHVMRDRFDLGPRVGRRDGEADPPHHDHVGEV